MKDNVELVNKLDKEMLERSKRLRIARALTGMPRENFCKKYGMSMYTLRSCELGHLPVSYKTADKVTKALEQESIFCTTEWIMEGKGQNPTIHRNKIDSKSLSLLSEEEVILQEIDFFRKTNNSTVILEITDDAMAPAYKIGDVVGGKFITNFNQLIGKICLIEIRPELFVLRKLTKDTNGSESWILSASNPETTVSESYIKLDKITALAPVLWTRRTLMSALE